MMRAIHHWVLIEDLLMQVAAVIKAVAAVAGQLAREGISKDRKNENQGFKFRGIDDVYNSLSLPLATAGLVCVPKVLTREVTERVTKKSDGRESVLFYVAVTVEYTLFCAEDGSFLTGVGVGEAMDSGDKATNKALSAAYKYFWFQLLCIPTEGDNDADRVTHADIAPKIPEGADFYWSTMEIAKTYADFQAAWANTPAAVRQWIVKARQAELAKLRERLTAKSEEVVAETVREHQA
jgi:hypothetical protein